MNCRDFSVFWVIKDAGNFLFKIQDPEGTVKAAAETANTAQAAMPEEPTCEVVAEAEADEAEPEPNPLLDDPEPMGEAYIVQDLYMVGLGAKLTADDGPGP